VSCAKTAEPIEMLSRWVQGHNIILHEACLPV